VLVRVVHANLGGAAVGSSARSCSRSV
jgi:hypothetical protein